MPITENVQYRFMALVVKLLRGIIAEIRVKGGNSPHHNAEMFKLDHDAFSFLEELDKKIQ